MTTRQAISGWLRDADKIPGHELVAELAAERDALATALDTITRCAKMAGPHGTTLYFISDDAMSAARAALAKATGHQ